MIGRKTSVIIIVALSVSFLLGGCGRQAIATNAPGTNRSLLIPVGRTAVVGDNSFQVFIDSEQYTPEPIFDDYGGYWIEVPFEDQINSKVVLRFTINGHNEALYHDEDGNMEKWLIPSALIDSDTPALVDAAKKLTGNNDTYMEKARSIHEFVIRYLQFQPYGRHYLSRASETYRMGYGTCVNYARLFVALSRAAGVPTRTVWGATFNDGAYEHHHEWAEYMDDDGYWHPLDLSYTTSFELSDINYLDLIYASEENPIYDRSTKEQYGKEMTQFIVYDTTAQPFDGRLGFTFVENNSPVSYVVENVFVLSEIQNLIPQMVP